MEKRYQYCEFGSVIEEQRTETDDKLAYRRRTAGSCMYHAICGLFEVLNENELRGRCPSEKNNFFARCGRTVIYKG